MSILIKDTTKEERAKIVEESIGNIAGACDGCSVGIVEMYTIFPYTTLFRSRYCGNVSRLY